MEDFSYDDLDDLYGEVIMDHYRHPKNRGEISNPDISSEGFNPFCGDRIILELAISKTGNIDRISFNGEGCSISQATASMMTENIKGRTLSEASNLSDIFRSMLHGNSPSTVDLDKLNDLISLQGVRKFPIRIKCALLTWAALDDGIREYTMNHP